MEKFKLNRTCETCDFYWDGHCACDLEMRKTDLDDENNTQSCDSWHESFEYFTIIEKNTPWYIKNRYLRGNAAKKTTAELLDMDYNGIPIDINIIDLIEHVYDVDSCVLAEMLGVTPGVVYYAKSRGTPPKRIPLFSSILKIPKPYFIRVTTCDIPIIEKYKEDFMDTWNQDLTRFKISAKKRRDEYIEQKIASELPYRLKENARLIDRYHQNTRYFHDLSDDYKARWNVVAIRLQDGNYTGNIYYRIGISEYGLVCIMEDILEFLSSLEDCSEISALNREGLLLNDINLRSDSNGQDIHFELFKSDNSRIEKCIPASDLKEYVVGFNIIETYGSGAKKERRKCLSCRFYSPIPNTATGHCQIRDESVARSRVICSRFSSLDK